MLKLKKIAITGGVASGKTTVCQLFKEFGAYVVHADEITHKLLDPHTHLGQQVIREFGPEIVKNGQIDRKKLADRAFKDLNQLKKLEEWIHPAVMRELERAYLTACQRGSFTAFVAEVPLLFEIGAEGFYDQVIAVVADETKAKERFKKAGFTDTQYALRMKRQLPPKEKALKANYIIHNNGSINDLRQEVLELSQKIQTL